MSESSIHDAAGGRRPIRHLDPDRVRRSPGASRVQETTYVADRLIVRGRVPRELRRRLEARAQDLSAGGSAGLVELDRYVETEGEPVSWIDGVRRVADGLGYGVAFDSTLGQPADDDEEVGYALRFVPLRGDDVEVDVWDVLEQVSRELSDLDEDDDGVEGEGRTPRVGLDHVMTAQRRPKHTPFPFIPVARPKHTPFPVTAVEEYGDPGTGGLTPVRYLGPAPRRPGTNGDSPWTDVDGRRRPVVAIVDTGIGSHPWFGDYDPHDPQDSDVVVRTASLDGRPLGAFPVPDHKSADSEYGGLGVDPLTGPLDPVAGHGTFMAGIVHQVCPEAVLVSVRAFGGSGEITEWQLLSSLRRVLRFHQTERPIDVVVLATGYYHEQPKDYGYDGPLRRLIRRFRQAGVLVVTAAGNDGTTRPLFPAAWAPHVRRVDGAAEPLDDQQLTSDHPPLLVAGASNPDGTTAVFSNDGPWVTCVCPGAAVMSTMPTTMNGPETPEVRLREQLRPGVRASVDPDDFTGGFATWSGTSFAAPFLAGEVARTIWEAEGNELAEARSVRAAWQAVTRTDGLFAEGCVDIG